MSAVTILVVDDEPSILSRTKAILEPRYTVDTAMSGSEALGRIRNGLAPHLIILDMLMPGMDGFQTLENCRQILPDQKVLMISSLNDPSKVVQAIKMGAADYILKPFGEDQIHDAVRRTLGPPPPQSLPDTSPAVKEIMLELDDDHAFIAASPAMRQIRTQVALIAKVDVPVLLLGESGVGKEIVARLIHSMSPKSHRPLLKVNCAALPVDLLESELFGYEKGAFTGAVKSKPGKFEMCDKGTILLDEIGEMTAPLQAKLLHVLQDGRFSRLGGRSNVAVDVRVLAATNIEIENAISERTFREDLYYRLNAFTIRIPPLRERREEIAPLLSYFMRTMSASIGKPALPISQKMLQECLRYPWPGNLRELGNFLKRYLVLEDEDLVLEELRMTEDGVSGHAGSGLKARVKSVKNEAECKEIRMALENANWNRKAAAQKLNISYKALLYKMKQHRVLSM
jgi:two-component system, NtrC family, response regulator AtoC